MAEKMTAASEPSENGNTENTDSSDAVAHIVNVDGACENNGKETATGGCGIFWGKSHPWNKSIKLDSVDNVKATNNRAEMMAAILALQQASEEGVHHLTVRTDSKYLQNGITQWISKWKQNGWKTEKKEPVVNKDLWVRLDTFNITCAVQWEWVKGHDGDAANMAADALARAAISLEAQQTPTAHGQPADPPPRKGGVNAAPVTAPGGQTNPANSTNCIICHQQENKQMLRCTGQECDSCVHYQCTELPVHILYQYTTKKRKYTCEKCVSVPQTFYQQMKALSPPSSSDNTTNRVTPDPHYLSKVDFMEEIAKVKTDIIATVESKMVEAIIQLDTAKKATQIQNLEQQLQTCSEQKSELQKKHDAAVKQRGNPSINDTAQLTVQHKLEKRIGDMVKEITSKDQELKEAKYTHRLELETITGIQKAEINSLLVRHEDNQKHIANLQSEIATLSAKLNDKDKSLTGLCEANTKLSNQLCKAGAEIVSLKLHNSRADDSLLQEESGKTEDTEKKRRRNVKIIGNSQTKGVRTERLSANYDVTKIEAYTIQQAASVIEKMAEKPDVTVCHLITNDIITHQHRNVHKT
jgi:ribonuclease HI